MPDSNRVSEKHRTTILYLANSFPEPIESYVWEEIGELKAQQADVIACGMRRPSRAANLPATSYETMYVFPLRLGRSVKASWVFLCRFFLLRDLFWRAIRGPEPFSRRMRALAHTWLGVYFAQELTERNVHHVHVHHGYFSAWVGMVAARILDIGFSMTLHGSDLLVKPRFLETKLKNCAFCITVSEFNKKFILENYPEISANRVFVQPLGIDLALWRKPKTAPRSENFTILTVGRLHPVKNHSFLVLSCRELKTAGARFRCVIAGEGEERKSLEQLINQLGLEEEIRLLGHISRDRLPELYARADVVVLTSHSEGLPLTLMEAMAMNRIVIAPQITGLGELVVPGETGFLYQPNSIEDFLAKMQLVMKGGPSLDFMRAAARQRVEQHFNSSVNLANFATRFLRHVDQSGQQSPKLLQKDSHENPLLQQI